MDAPTVRAACPNCQTPLRIPAAWAGQVVKCKKCGSGVRVRSGAAPIPQPVPQPAPPAVSAFADMRPAAPANDNPFDDPPPAYNGNGYTAPVPAYPYPVPPGAPAVATYPAPPAGYPYPMPAGYPQPVALPAPAQVPSAAFAPSEATAAHRKGRPYRRGPDRMKYVWIGVTLLVTAGLAFAAIHFAKQFEKKEKGGVETAGGEPKGGTPSGQPVSGGPKTTNLFANNANLPRRFLFIHISNYLYLNPLTSSAMIGQSRGADLTRSAAIRLSYEWKIPRDKENDQLFLLSDTASPPENRMPMRDVLMGTYDKFFETSRAQDRIMVYFGGHVLTIEGKTYLVPIEGDPDEPDKLIPLEDFYAKMKACKATQKVVIWDVCRFNPERGRSRPGSEPMSEETAKALSAVPPGVQAILTCRAGENALEFYNSQPDGPTKPSVFGSNFLAATRYVSDKSRNNSKEQKPDDPFPVEEWSKALAQRVASVVAVEGKGKQTVSVVGSRPESLVAANKDETMATRFEYPPSPMSASPTEIGAIASEINLPGIRKDEDSGIAGFPFPREVLAPYTEDVSLQTIRQNKDKYPLRIAVLDAQATIKDIWEKKGGEELSLREEFVGPSSDAVKKEVLKEQLFPARGITKLESAIIVLESVSGMRDAEPKRWQANYDYMLAQCKARLAWMNEYDLALGSIRTEVLPTLKPGQDGYRLISQEKMKVKKEAKYAEEAKEIYQKIIMEFKGSPWAIQAKRDKAQSLGLAWQPFSSKAATEPPTQ